MGKRNIRYKREKRRRQKFNYGVQIKIFGYGDTWYLPGCQASLRKSCPRGGVSLDSGYCACIRVSTGVCPRFSKMVLKRTGQPYGVASYDSKFKPSFYLETSSCMLRIDEFHLK
ncbi:hypothetical protein AVEN_132721-1 [Araneus ventricosus]|uniref:Uncharacterized protein n=1 Tax=Araneus ventricosus TaxID=182803 RepID=A0A4Y2VTQ8_ARAVE|nr:hypothetical protein AVEN_132721-1 [Araneus ventricosus]